MTQSTATPSGYNAMKFSAEVSEAHAAARVKCPDAADVDNKLALRHFNNFFQTRPGLRRSLFPLCLASRAATF